MERIGHPDMMRPGGNSDGFPHRRVGALAVLYARATGSAMAFLDAPNPVVLRVVFAIVLGVFCIVWPWQHTTLLDPISPDAGLSVIPADIRAMRVLANRHGISRFRLASELETTPEVPSLAMEHLYPARLMPDASAQFVRRGSVPPPACVAVDSAGGISLLECRQ